jgi:hypothetical protein
MSVWRTKDITMIETQELEQLRTLNAELLAACKALQMEARARNCGLRIADEAIAKAEAMK